jgi:hypothetical protein
MMISVYFKSEIKGKVIMYNTFEDFGKIVKNLDRSIVNH